jgi:hypothetical protein
VPAVLELARANQFYREEQRIGRNLRDLAEDHESAMTGLTKGEQLRLQAAEKRYQPILDEKTVSVVMSELKAMLKAQYEASPASITRIITPDIPVTTPRSPRVRLFGRSAAVQTVLEESEEVIPLPLGFEAFGALDLTQGERAEAKKAYYQHPQHTAYRYLSKPNHWMHRDAEYVNHSQVGAWSTFDEYVSLISLFFLAASDEESEPCDGYTLETRILQFIRELAYIGRAHNWDRRDAAGNEYDDLEDDKPSCFSGVKRRLFQSVQGHKLLKILTIDDIKLLLKSFVREHFKAMIEAASPEKVKAWQEAWDELCETGTPQAILSELDVSEDTQFAWLDKLSDEHSSKFTMDLVAYIRLQFECDDIAPNHASRFGGEVNLAKLLDETTHQQAVSEQSIFHAGEAPEDEDASIVKNTKI